MKEAYSKLLSTIVANLGIDHTVTGDLLQLYFSRDTALDMLSIIFSKYDIELLEYRCVWLVSRLASRLHYSGIPKEQFPRIKGVVKKFAVENGRCLAVLPSVLRAFNAANVAVLLLSGTAMKVLYEPAETRYYSEIVFLVHAEDVNKAGLILEKCGFQLQDTYWGRSAFQKNDVRVVIHSIYLRSNVLTGDSADIWRQSLESSWQGERVFVPNPEMMFLILLIQGLENCCLRIHDSQANDFVNNFLDIKSFLTNNTLRWAQFIGLAEKSRFTLHACLMLDVLNQLYPGTVPEYVLESLQFTGEDIDNVQKLVSYYVSKNKMADSRNRGSRAGYYYNGILSLWNLNCYYGNRSSLFSNIIDFPQLIAVWNNHKGIKGLMSKLRWCRI